MSVVQFRLLLTSVILLWGLFACKADEDSLIPLPNPSYFPPAETSTPPPPETSSNLPEVRDICVLGDVRCTTPFTGSIDICRISEDASVEATRWFPELCPGGRVCIDGRCQKMACEPGRATCSEFEGLGVCNDRGDGLVDIEPCPEDTLCRGGACVDSCASLATAKSYIGCEYKVIELAAYREDYAKAPFGLIVANVDPLHETKITVLDANGEPAQLLNSNEVSAGGVPPIASQSFVENPWLGKRTLESSRAEDIVIPRQGMATLLFASNPVRFGETSVSSRVRTLRATRPVVAYQMNPYCCFDSFSNDATILFPTSSLGTRYTVPVAPDWPIPGGERTDGAAFGGGVTIAATRDETTVRVELPENTLLADPPLGEESVPSGEQTFEMTLNDGELLYLESKSSSRAPSTLNGVHIESSAPVAVFSSHPCSFIPHDTPACDHLESQVTPEETLGKQFVLSALEWRSSSYDEVIYWHLQASKDTETVVTFRENLTMVSLQPSFAETVPNCTSKLENNSVNVVRLGGGEGCIFGTRSSLFVRSSQPLAVFGYITSQDTVPDAREGQATGDPSMFLLPPIEQYRDEYSFLTPFTYDLDFITLTISEDAVSTITLDGLPVDPRAEGITWQPVIGTPYVTVNIPVSDGAHFIEAEDSFGLIVYAYDQYVSFAYPGGMNLTKRSR